MGNITEQEMCACGKPLHYSSKLTKSRINGLIGRYGKFIEVETPQGRWKVPRHYIALHGLKADELPILAIMLGFEKVA